MSLKRNILWNIAGASTPLLVAVFSIPYLLRTLGAEGFGVLTLVWALIGYFSLFDFGIGKALTYELSRRSSSEMRELAPYVQAGIALTCATGVLGAALIAVLAKPLSSNWLNISSNWKRDAFIAFLIAAVGIIPTTITSGLRGALEGINRFPASNINRIALGSLMFALPAWAVFFHGNHLWIATLYMVAARFALMLVVLYQLRHLMQSIDRLKRDHLNALLSYGAWLTVTGIVGPLMIFGDRFFVSAAIGAELLPQYVIPQEGLQRLLLIPAAICGALLPRMASLPRGLVADEYKRNFKRVAWGMFGVCTAVALISYPALSIWISPTFADSALTVTLILTIGIWFNAIAMVPYTIIHALGEPKITAILHIIELFLYVILLWVLAHSFGLVGAALAWTGRVILDFILMQIIMRKILNIG
jgi:O-antigen/teichoic acid export membrane protein